MESGQIGRFLFVAELANTQSFGSEYGVVFFHAMRDSFTSLGRLISVRDASVFSLEIRPETKPWRDVTMPLTAPE